MKIEPQMQKEIYLCLRKSFNKASHISVFCETDNYSYFKFLLANISQEAHISRDRYDIIKYGSKYTPIKNDYKIIVQVPKHAYEIIKTGGMCYYLFCGGYNLFSCINEELKIMRTESICYRPAFEGGLIEMVDSVVKMTAHNILSSDDHYNSEYCKDCPLNCPYKSQYEEPAK